MIFSRAATSEEAEPLRPSSGPVRLARRQSQTWEWYCRKGRLRKQGAERAYSRTTASHGTTAARIIPATRLFRLAFLAPDIVTAILDGRHPSTVNAAKLLKDTRLPLDWDEQRAALGFA